MAELAALGVAASIAQFVALGFSITKSVIETYRSTDPDGLAEQNADLLLMTTSLKNRCEVLREDAKVKVDATTMHLTERCIKIADRLLFELNSLTIKRGNRRRRWLKFLAGVKAQRAKGKIEGLQNRLLQIKSEICERLEHIIHEQRRSLSEAMRSLGDASDAWNNATEKRLDAMAINLQSLIRYNVNLEEACMEKFGSFAVTLSKFADEAKNRGTICKILTSLNFSQIKARQNEIPRAHQNTFEWIFDESREASLPRWLQSTPDGVFWVTGKPGSGKSTLMKLILGDQRTSSLAKSWAGPKPLVIASHFFWNAGKPIQKSQEGLLRTLLFQILVQCPEVIPEVCFERYSNPLRALEPWGVEDLSGAFSRIREIQDLPCRVLMLVDGLDEYGGDPKELTQFLHAVARSSEVRVCCASRPWKEFSEPFGNSAWQVQVHELTKADIRSYIDDHLGQHGAFVELRAADATSANDFVESIASKAEGVFFWVFLVIKSILRGLDNHDDLATLQRRLDQLPSDLNGFFQRMMDSIEGVYRREAYLTFLILLSARTALPVGVLMALDRLDRVDKKGRRGLENRAAFRQALSLETPEDVSIEARRSRSEQMEKDTLKSKDQIVARCRDLVQVSETDGEWSYSRIRIGFIHRTVVEFLDGSQVLKQLETLLPHSPRLLLAAAYSTQLMSLERASWDYAEMFLRLLYQIQETEAEEFAADGPIFWQLHEVHLDYVKKRSMPVKVQDGATLVRHAEARLMLGHDLSISQRREGTELIVQIISGLLEGCAHIEIGNPSSSSISDTIDLDLLDGMLRMAKDRSLINTVWRNFIGQLAGPPFGSRKQKPKNVWQACRLLVEHGAPRCIEPPEIQAKFETDDVHPKSRHPALRPGQGCEPSSDTASSDNGSFLSRYPSPVRGFDSDPPEKNDVVVWLRNHAKITKKELKELDQILTLGKPQATSIVSRVWEWFSVSSPSAATNSSLKNRMNQVSRRFESINQPFE